MLEVLEFLAGALFTLGIITQNYMTLGSFITVVGTIVMIKIDAARVNK